MASGVLCTMVCIDASQFTKCAVFYKLPKFVKCTEYHILQTPSCRCGHCKSLAPHWASAATELKGKVKLGALDATVHTVMASRYQIQGFPTIKYFPTGKKDWNSAENYDGGRTTQDIVQWAKDKWTVHLPPPEVTQVSSNAVC